MHNHIPLSKKKYIGLGHVPVGIGAVLKGWDIEELEYRNPLQLPVVNFRAMTEACPHNCPHCFTDKKRRTLTISEIRNIIDQLADAQTHAIDFVGEGEPTIDPHFFSIIEYTVSKGIHPVIYTDAATQMRNVDFIKRVFDSGASVSPKCDSLFNEDYQNWVVGDKQGKYFRQRNEALDLLIASGFNEVQPDGTTRLGFDMVVSKRNMDEVEKTLHLCRENNLWVIFTFYLPSGRSARDDFDITLAVNEDDKTKIRDIIRKVDEEYGFSHPAWNNLLTTRCIEFLQIYGDGGVSACVGNEKIGGNIREASLKELEQTILKFYPIHDRATFDGHCPYRPGI